MTDQMKIPAEEELRRRNRRFGIVLGAIVAGIFVLTFAIAIFIHYADAHHVAGGS
ncbi:MAG: hypothetical protein KGL10_03305 [Alphaproteobacteria bacterium]|nr:hypothetical protein [Alphaproteobacteria bacterium]MDE2336317.1 hypothetical protein [Alphaproteobacteria bacterium]